MIDLNLLFALDVLLEERSVSRAARRMNMSVPAMSRVLTRIRDALGDPILVRAGRTLVPTARAVAMRDRVRAVLGEARSLLTEGELDLGGLRRSFIIRSADAAVGAVGTRLAAAMRAEAPGVSVIFVPEGEEEVAPLRDGRIDLDLGVAGNEGPELRVQGVATGAALGVVRRGHPLTSGKVTAQRFIEFPHVGVSRRGKMLGPIDSELAKLGLSRTVAMVTPSFCVALHCVAEGDLVGMVASWVCPALLEKLGLVVFPLPVTTPMIAISQTWHPRHDADPAHRWLREHMRAAWQSRDTPVKRARAR